MIGVEFEFHAPRQLAEALALLSQLNDRATVLAGGMSLMPAMNLGLVQPSAIVSLNHLPDLDYVLEEDGWLRIGAQTRHHTVENHTAVQATAPHVAEAARAIGDVQVRHRGTIGGSIAHADPAANYLPALLVSDARLLLRSAVGERVVSVRNFIVGPLQTTRAPGELLAEIQVPRLADSGGAAYLQFTRVEGSFPLVTAAALVEPSTGVGRLAIGGVSTTPLLVEALEMFSGGGMASDAVLAELGRRAEAAVQDPLEDMHGDAAYRRALAGVFARRVARAAVGRSANRDSLHGAAPPCASA
jgi:CO/xanthine dehydrogenase FAD-binding subunit